MCVYISDYKCYTISGEVIKRIVLVTFSNNQLTALLKYQYQMQQRYMKDIFNENDNINLQLQTVSSDYDNMYEYDQEHHTLERYMRIWERHNHDVIQKGTPPTI